MSDWLGQAVPIVEYWAFIMAWAILEGVKIL